MGGGNNNKPKIPSASAPRLPSATPPRLPTAAPPKIPSSNAQSSAPPPPPPPSKNLSKPKPKMNKPTSSGDRGALLSSIRQGAALRKVPKSQMKRPLSPKSQAKSSSSSSSSDELSNISVLYL
mmetsp:Transcript_1964/g.2817  ORF Transcript_1964/g.2817 Transcript_1964/m.2817 type:complete len:123 (-) Transcript_1964:325-693(-)